MYRAILFDMDGTLLAPSIDFPALRMRLGVPEKEGILDWVLGQPADRRRGLEAILTAVELEAAGRAALLPGAAETLAWVRERGLQSGILTRNCREAWAVAWGRCGLERDIEVFTRESAPAKPDPACLAPILASWGVEAGEIVHVGDYLHDLTLARRCGMHSILLHPSGGNPFAEGCDFIARDHTELLVYLKQVFA